MASLASAAITVDDHEIVPQVGLLMTLKMAPRRQAIAMVIHLLRYKQVSFLGYMRITVNKPCYF